MTYGPNGNGYVFRMKFCPRRKHENGMTGTNSWRSRVMLLDVPYWMLPGRVSKVLAK